MAAPTLVLVGAVGLFALLLAVSVHLVAGNSDGATVLLEGSSMRAGNVALAGWSLSLDSFWLIDVPFYAVAVLLGGVHTVLLNVVPSLIALLVIAVAAVAARDGRSGTAAAFALGTVIVLLGLPGPAFAIFFLQGPLHVGTVLWCLLAFLGLRSGRVGIGWVLAVVLLAAGMLGDLQMLPLGIVPVLGAGVLAAARGRRVRDGQVLVSAGILAAVVARLGRLVASAVGTYAIGRTNPLAPLAQIARNLGAVFTEGGAVLGIWNGPYGASGVPAVLQAVHVVAAVVIAAGVIVALWRVVGSLRPVSTDGAAAAGTTTLGDLLVVGFVADLATFVCLAATGSDAYARYLTAGVVYGSILAGRAVGDALADRPARVARRAAAAGLVVAAAFAASTGFALAAPAAPQPAVALGAFLEAHHLHLGVGDYWSASITTVETDGAVTVRPIVEGPQGRIVRYDKQSEADWYRGTRFQFLVYNTALIWNGVDLAPARATFGRLRHDWPVGTYRVLVFARPIMVSVHGATQP